jgi:signal transduction histidine kinase/ActR/RegA family two-component response regulator
MSGIIRRLPIRQKLVLMIMATSIVVLILASAGYIVTDYYESRDDLRRELTALSEIIVQNSTAALQFLDPVAADETLQTLAQNRHIRSACLYDARGALFARYSSATSRPCAAAPGPDGYQFSSDGLSLVTSVAVKGARAGTLFLRSDLEVLRDRLRVQFMIVALLLVLTTGVALAMSSRLQSLVSEPVTALARTASDVSARGDYSIRAARTTDDELGVLVDAFNRMLERIQLREGELSAANEDLRREVAERRRAEQERAELLVREREANRLKDEFLATLSHELRTPLNAILGWTKLLRSDAVPPSGVDRALEKIERNAQVQSRLVEDLLEVSRIASGKLRLELKPLDLAALTTTAIESIRPTADARGTLIERQFDGPAFPTAGDPDRLQQVIWNLLSNAVKFTPSGGTVTIRLRRDDAVDELSVSDTGIGIEPAFLPNVFDMFRQADASSTRAHGGLGLGLSIVRNLVEMHGGDVRVESDGLNKGARFVVRLPVRVLGRARDPLTPDVQAGRTIFNGLLPGANIVVVDDDSDTRELLQSVFESAGATVRVAASAEEAFTACIEDRPDVLVTDIAMPGQDGYALMRQLQAAMGRNAPRASVALTAFAGARDRERSTEAGFDCHIAKPFDPEELVRTVMELLQPGRTSV